MNLLIAFGLGYVLTIAGLHPVLVGPMVIILISTTK